MRLIICLVLGFSLSACATTYKEMGWGGGVKAEQVTKNTYRISARGNEYTDSATIKDYALLKAAETTKQAGGTHFIVVNASDASTQDTYVSGGTATSNVIGSTVYTNYSPPTVTNVFMPGQDAYIRVLNIVSGKKAPQGAYSADEIIKFVGARVKRG